MPQDDSQTEQASAPQPAETPQTPAPQPAETPADTPTARYRQISDRYGEKTGHKIDVTLRDRTGELDKTQKALQKAQQAFDDAPIGKEEKAEKELEKARKAYEEAKAELDSWKAVKEEHDKIVQAEAKARAEQDALRNEQAVEEERQRQAEEIAKREEQAERGAHAVHPAIREKWDAAPKIEGAENEITLANGERVKGRYVLVESGAATPSHNPGMEFVPYEGFPVDENGQTVNDRDYERDKEAQDITRQTGANYDSRALQSVPVVSNDGVVLSGNGRTMAGELAARDNTDGAYIDHLRKYPQQFGFTSEQVDGMQHPRVLFVPDEPMPYTTETFAKFNQQDMKSQSRTEQSVKLGKTVDDATFNRVIRSINSFDTIGDFYNDTKASTEAISELRNAGAINSMQYAEMFDGEKISGIGRQMLENMLIGKAFESNPDAIRQLAEYPSMRQSVISALAEISTNVGLGEEYSLESELAEAISLAYQARKNGYKAGDLVSDYARQLNLFPFEMEDTVADYTNATVLMLADVLNDNRTSILKKALTMYNHAATDSASGQMDIFSGSVKDRKEIIKDVLNTLNYGTQKEQQAALTAATERRKAEAAGQSTSGESLQQDGTTPAGDNGSTERELVDNLREKGRQEKIIPNLGSKYSLSSEEANNGELFYQNEDGSTTLASIPDEIFERLGLPPVPFKLTETMGWHVYDHHAKEANFGNIGDAIDFVLSIVNNVDHVRLGRDNSYIFSVEDGRSRIGKRAITIIINSDNGEFMGIRTSGYETLGKLKERPLLWERGAHAAPEDVATPTITTIESQQGDENSSRTKSQSNVSSEGKGSEQSAAVQGKGERLAENQSPNAVQSALAVAEQETNTEPTEAQKEAGNYKKGHVKIDGYDVTIENPKGSVRRGTDASGKQWEQEMQNTYGYIRGTEGVDGDHIDVFFSDDPSQGDVFVVDQVNKDGSFDEHKVMYGFPDIESARKAYLSNYEDGWQGLGAITPVSKEEFKKWIDSSHRKTKPFAEYSSVKPLDKDSEKNSSVQETSAKNTAAHFPMETQEEAMAFDNRVPEMDDAELLAYMQADGKGNINKASHPSVYDEYDYRHGDEQLQSYDDTLVRLNESSTTLEQAEEMLANIHGDMERLATEERPLLLGQEEALQEYIAGLEKIHYDRQGNPVDADGNLILEEISSVDELKGEDFSNPTRNVQLPKIPERVDKAIGAGGKPVIIKKNIFEKNKANHPELKPSQSRKILKDALYSTNLYGQTQPKSRPNYWVVIRTSDPKKVVVLEVSENKENVEIVGWRYAGERQLEELRKQAEREDGQLLILTSEKEAAAGLSTLPSDVSSGKATDLFGNEQGSGKIDDVGEVLAGARKDMRREIAESLANVTEAALVEKPFGKVYKKPDLKKAVESGALREKDAIFYEAFFSMVNQQKPKVTQSEVRSKRYIPGYKTKAERWASDTFKQMEVLRQFMELDEAGRDTMMERMLADRYPTREQELAEIEKRKGWNPDYDGHKYEWGDKTTPNPLWVTHEVMNRLGYGVGDKLDVPYGVVKANTSGTGYSIENLKGERASLFGSGMTLDEAIDRIVYLAKLKRGDADVSHPTQLFAFPATKSESGESGRYRVMWGRDYKTREFDSKEDADAFAQTKNGAYVSPIMETKRRFGYKVRFTHPLTGEKMFVDNAEFDTKDEAQAYFDGNFEKLNEATNAKLQDEREKKGEKKTLTADDVVHVQMIHSKDDGWKYAVVIDKKYANNDGMVHIIKEGFASRKDAETFADGVKDEVLKTVLKHKEDAKKIVYFDTGENSRIGEDYRNGKNVDAEDFMNTFGFRGVQFGNWTNQADRQMAVNQAYDAFMDMARLIGVSPKAMSLNGELGIAFGARGVGGFAAHYEPGEVVINLTKTHGAGSLAHEWWHALDNYFARRAGSAGDMVTDNRRIEMRDALRKAFNDMLSLVNSSDYAQRSAAKGEYWGRTHEITARLLAEWVDRELKKRGELNTFLSRGAVVERGQQHNYDVYEALERLAGREPMPFEEYKELPESLKGIPYPSAKEVEQFGGALRHIFDTLEEKVDEETGNVMLYEPTTTYETRDGKKVVWRSLFDDMGVRSSDEVAKVSQHTGKEKPSDAAIAPSEIRLRKLKKGETCHVERVYEETKQFDFTGKEKVESAEDVAYIFRQLENAAVENSFLVLVKDGKPTVIHLGVGSYVGVMAPYEQALVAYSKLKPEQVYFVHNHPSGTLEASRQDQELLNRIKRAFGEDVVQQGIIIDTTSGNYGEFESIETAYETYSVEEEMPQSQGGEVPVKVYQFSRQVFAPDWNPESAFKIVSSQSVAEFVSSHRLGEHKKMSFLVVNNNGNVVANVFLPWTKLSDIKRRKDAGDLLAGYVHQCGGVRGVLYGNYDYEPDDQKVLASVGLRMRQLNAPLLDALHVEHSAFESGWDGVGEPMKSFGGNSGYVGYSKSKRAVEAEERGLRNKSQMNKDFAEEVNRLIQEQAPGTPKVTLKMIKDALGKKIKADEWHHTSKYGNRTDYWSAETVAAYFTPESAEDVARREAEEQRREERTRKTAEIESKTYDAIPKEEADYWLENDYQREFPQHGAVFVTSNGDRVVVWRDLLEPSTTIDLIPKGENVARRAHGDWQYENWERVQKALAEYNEAKAKALESVKSEYGKLFSEREQDAVTQNQRRPATKKTLMGVHNISEEKLRKAIRQGGLANPSLAVIDTGNGIHSDFGDISLIPKSTLIDSETGRNAGTYTGDAWTSTYPHVTRRLTKQGDEHIERMAMEAAGGDTELERHLTHNLRNYIEGANDITRMLYLIQKGIEPEIVPQRTTHSQDEFDAIQKIFGEGTTNMPTDMTKEQNDALLDLMVSTYEKKLREKENPSGKFYEHIKELNDQRIKEYRDSLTDENGKIWFAKGDTFVFDNWRDEKRRKEGTPDWYWTDNAARDKVTKEGLTEDFEKWKEGLFDEGDIEEVLFAGFDRDGNRKYVPNTVANASRLMNKEADTNAYNNGGLNATRSGLLKKMLTLSAIRKNKNLLQGKDKYEEKQKEMSDKLFGIIEQVSDMQQISDNKFSNIDYAEARLQEAITRRDPVAYLNKEYGYHIDKDGELAKEIAEFKKEASNLPVKYFETKFRRPVGLNEFSVAVVPENTSVDVVKALQDAGLDVRTYDGTEEDRKAVTLEAVSDRNDVLFREESTKDSNDKFLGDYSETETPSSAETIGSTATETGEKLGVKVRLIHSREELPKEWTEKQKRNRRGWYDTRTGEIAIVVPNNADAGEVVRTLLHEAVGHKGLRELFGEDFDIAMDNIYHNVTEEIREQIDDKARQKGWNTNTATEEYLSSLAEDANYEAAKKNGTWAKIKNAIIEMLRRVGLRLGVKLTDADLRYILWRSHENMKENGRRGVFGEAKDAAMREKLGVNKASEALNERFSEREEEGSGRSLFEQQLLALDKLAESHKENLNIRRMAIEAMNGQMKVSAIFFA